MTTWQDIVRQGGTRIGGTFQDVVDTGGTVVGGTGGGSTGGQRSSRRKPSPVTTTTTTTPTTKVPTQAELRQITSIQQLAGAKGTYNPYTYTYTSPTGQQSSMAYSQVPKGTRIELTQPKPAPTKLAAYSKELGGTVTTEGKYFPYLPVVTSINKGKPTLSKPYIPEGFTETKADVYGVSLKSGGVMFNVLFKTPQQLQQTYTPTFATPTKTPIQNIQQPNRSNLPLYYGRDTTRDYLKGYKALPLTSIPVSLLSTFGKGVAYTEKQLGIFFGGFFKPQQPKTYRTDSTRAEIEAYQTPVTIKDVTRKISGFFATRNKIPPQITVKDIFFKVKPTQPAYVTLPYQMKGTGEYSPMTRTWVQGRTELRTIQPTKLGSTPIYFNPKQFVTTVGKTALKSGEYAWKGISGVAKMVYLGLQSIGQRGLEIIGIKPIEAKNIPVMQRSTYVEQPTFTSNIKVEGMTRPTPIKSKTIKLPFTSTQLSRQPMMRFPYENLPKQGGYVFATGVSIGAILLGGALVSGAAASAGFETAATTAFRTSAVKTTSRILDYSFKTTMAEQTLRGAKEFGVSPTREGQLIGAERFTTNVALFTLFSSGSKALEGTRNLLFGELRTIDTVRINYAPTIPTNIQIAESPKASYFKSGENELFAIEFTATGEGQIGSAGLNRVVFKQPYWRAIASEYFPKLVKPKVELEYVGRYAGDKLGYQSALKGISKSKVLTKYGLSSEKIGLKRAKELIRETKFKPIPYSGRFTYTYVGGNLYAEPHITITGKWISIPTKGVGIQYKPWEQEVTWEGVPYTPKPRGTYVREGKVNFFVKDVITDEPITYYKGEATYVKRKIEFFKVGGKTYIRRLQGKTMFTRTSSKAVYKGMKDINIEVARGKTPNVQVEFPISDELAITKEVVQPSVEYVIPAKEYELTMFQAPYTKSGKRLSIKFIKQTATMQKFPSLMERLDVRYTNLYPQIFKKYTGALRGKPQPRQVSPTEVSLGLKKKAEEALKQISKTAAPQIPSPIIAENVAPPISIAAPSKSIYAGKGTYELTSGGLGVGSLSMNVPSIDITTIPTTMQTPITSNVQIQNTKLIQKQNQLMAQKQVQMQTQIQVQKQVQKQVQAQKQAQKQVQVQKQVQMQTQIQVQKQVQAQKQIQLQKQMQLQKQIQVQTNININKRPPFINLYPRITPKSKILDKVREAFNVVIYRRGKEETIARGLPRGKALKLGVKSVLANLRASFKLKPSGTTSIEDISYKLPTTFRTGKYDKLRFVQKLTTRFGTRGETKEAQFFRKVKKGKVRWF